MSNKLGTYCDRVIEAGWLGALIIVPLFFNVYSSRVFEPDKISLLRSIALMMIAAWLIKLLDRAIQQEKQQASVPGIPNALQRWVQTPIVLPTLLLAVVYLFTTLTSVVPRISFWGSYQRLQGTYTTLSYLVVFFMLLGHLRTRAQLERLLNVVILTSLPISLYGLLQHYRLDPLPWGGDVTFRVASNMGNSIFVAAYLIMVVPLTLEGIIRTISEILSDQERHIRIAFGLGYILLFILQIIAWTVTGYTRGLLLSLIFVLTIALFSPYLGKPLAPFIKLGCYSLILPAQLVCIFFTQSRGPWLGLLGGLGFLFLVWALVRGRRKIALGIIAVTVLFGLFLIVLNLPRGPFQAVRKVPYVGRMARIFETGSGTGKVRTLIWDGAVRLIASNPVRTIIGYGPESMYVAYNPFYPPELAHYERRNASPDRSHNEMLDALVTTGLIGLVVYLFLFGSIFYYALKWLGLMHTRHQRNTLAVLVISRALLGILTPILVEGTWRFIGVGLPAGFVIGLFEYLVIYALFWHGREETADMRTQLMPAVIATLLLSLLGTFIVWVIAYARKRTPLQKVKIASGEDRWRQFLLLALFGAIVAHFIEIHIGIAIAATRTYFWAYVALLILLGTGRISPYVEATPAPKPTPSASTKRRRRRKRKTERAPRAAFATVERIWPQLIAYCLLAALIFATMGFDYITNPLSDPNVIRTIWRALTTFRAKGQAQTSYGMLWMFVVVWITGGLMIVSTIATRDEQKRRDIGWWFSALGTYALFTTLIPIISTALNVSRLIPGGDAGMTITCFYITVGVLLLAIATALWYTKPLPSVRSQRGRWLNYLIYAGLIVIIALFIFVSNTSPIRADIYYKQGWSGYHSKAENPRVWNLDKAKRQQYFDIAIALYNKAIQCAPKEDHYYLFLGKALLERAEVTDEMESKAKLLEQGRQVLEKARELNPLNTDHTANLARLYRIWGNMIQDKQRRAELLQRSLEYYEQATKLSPNNAQLYNEWGLVYYTLGDYDAAYEKLQHSLDLDQKFYQTYLLLGDLNLAQGKLNEAAEAFRKVIELKPDQVQAHSSLGYIYSQQGRLQEALEENLIVAQLRPNDFSTRKNLAILYQHLGQLDEAIAQAKKARELAPEKERAAMDTLIQHLQQAKEDKANQKKG